MADRVGNFQNVADGSATDVPFTMHFQAGQEEHHVTAEQMCKMAVIDNAATLHATGFSVTGGHNMNSSATTVSVLQGHPEDCKPMPTLSRHYVVTARGDNLGPTEQSAVIATHAVLHPGYNNTEIRHDFVSGLDCNGASPYVHPDQLDATAHEALIKKSLLWDGHHGQSAEELKQGLQVAEKNGVTRYAVPVLPVDSPNASGMIKLVARNLGPKAEDLSRLRAMFPTSAVESKHHVMMVNPHIGKANEEVPHVILSAADCDKAATALEANLKHPAFSNGLTVRCNTLSGEPTDGDTFVHCVLHRSPVTNEDAQPGTFLSKVDAGKLAGQVGSGGGIAPMDNVANLIFQTKCRDGAGGEGEATLATPAVAAVVDGDGGDE